jgi:hypothetical protein
VEEDAFDKVSKASALGAGALQLSAEEADGKFLKKLIGGVAIAENALQIAADRAAVAIEHFPLCLGGRTFLIFVGAANQRPLRGDATQVVVKAIGRHVSRL